MSPSKRRRQEERQVRFHNPELFEQIRINKPKLGMQIQDIQPKTFHQARTMKEFEKGNHLILTGCAGTGKTYLSLYLALKAIEQGMYDKLVIVRSCMPSRDIGALPGDVKEKGQVYEQPYVDNVNELFGRGDAYQTLKNKKIIEFETTSFLRGRTINNAIILFDEVQNALDTEAMAVFTRVGKDCRVLTCGDGKQTDYLKYGKSSFCQSLDILSRMEDVVSIPFGIEDIVRSGFVRDYLRIKEELNY